MRYDGGEDASAEGRTIQMFRKTVGLASAAVLALGLGAAAASSAQAKPAAESGTTAACALRLGSVTANGAFTSRMINATAPITVGGVRGTAGVFPAGQVQHISTVSGELLGAGGETRTGLTVMGGALYSSSFTVDTESQLDPHYPHTNLRIGGGWANYRWIDQSVHRPANAPPGRRCTPSAPTGSWTAGLPKAAAGARPAGSAVSAR